MTELMSRETIDEWCKVELEHFDLVSLEYHKLIALNETGTIHQAKIRRAESKMITARVGAGVAAYLLQILETTRSGSIVIDIPEGELQLKLRW